MKEGLVLGGRCYRRSDLDRSNPASVLNLLQNWSNSLALSTSPTVAWLIICLSQFRLLGSPVAECLGGSKLPNTAYASLVFAYSR